MAKDAAIQNTLDYKDGFTFSDGNIIVGVSNDHVAVNFNNTEHNQNSLLVLDLRAARALLALLHAAGKAQGWSA
jgi:hypothetical protein